MRPWTLAAQAALAALTLALAGCGQEADQTAAHAPVPVGSHDRCHLCGMVIVHYEGPKAEIFIKDVPEPLKFCSGRDAFTFALQPENARRLEGFFIHDLARTDWKKPDDKAFADARQLHYVYGTRVPGVMGNEPAGFGTEQAARDFIAREGGALFGYADVTLKLLEQ